MKQIGNSFTVIAVLVCAAVLLVPMAQAQESAAGSAPGQGVSGNGGMNPMSNPPSGNSGTLNGPGGQDTGNHGNSGMDGNSGGDGTSRAPPSDGQNPGEELGTGNMTGHVPPSGGFGNATSQRNGPGFGNMSRQGPPSEGFGNETAPGTMPGETQGFGNMTSPERPAGEFSNVTSRGDAQGMGNMTFHAPPAGDFGNSTAAGDGPGALQGSGNITHPQPGNNENPAGQKSVTAGNEDIIAQIKALLSKLF
ncbi:MAG: hypothetical protein WC593_13495 [Methanoregula sp.]